MKPYENYILYPEGSTEKQKKYFRSYIEHLKKEKEYLCVIYRPNCGCKIEHFVILDRYPMTPKIINKCPECEKGCLLEISDPILFHLPLLDQDYTLEDLKNSVVTEGPQASLIRAYQEQGKDTYE